MRVTEALLDGIKVPFQSPTLLLGVLLFSLVNTSVTAIQLVNPIYAIPLSFVVALLVPFFLGGLLSLVREAFEGTPSLSTLFEDGAGNYLRMLAASIIVYVILFVMAIIASVVVAVGATFLLGFSSSGGVSGAMLPVLVFGLIGFSLVLVPFMLVQFYPAAIVFEDTRIVESLQRSFGLVRSNFSSVLGFDLLAIVVNLLASILLMILGPSRQLLALQASSNPYGAGGIAATPSLSELALPLAAMAVISTISYSILLTYYVSFYGRLLAAGSEGDGESDTEPVADSGTPDQPTQPDAETA